MIKEIERRENNERLRFLFPADKSMWHLKQIEFHTSQKRNKWTLSGNRTGKTVAGATEVVLSVLGDRARKYISDWPEEMQVLYEPIITRFDHMRNKQVETWVVSPSNEVQRDVAQKEILKWLPRSEYDPKRISVRLGRKDDLENAVIDTIPLKNGRKIGFKSSEMGREKFQGTSKPLIWFDEEPPKDIYDECLMRTLDCRGFIIGTMTPLQGLTYVYDTIYLNNTKPVDHQDHEIFYVQWDWDDNPYLSREEKKRLEATLEPNELEARKYGRFIMPGKCAFDLKAVTKMLEGCVAGVRGNLSWVGKFHEAVKWEEDPQGDYEVWNHPDPDHEYLIAADVAEGLEYGDFDAVGVLNRDTVALDAVYHGKVDPDMLADYIARLGVYYNKPMVAPEGNNHGLTTISHLKLVYPDIYRSMVVDKVTEKETTKLGWYTTTKTRPLAVDSIKRAVREGQFTCYWRRFVDEAMNFIRHPNGKEAARAGYWDDAVMMLAILLHIHNTTPRVKNMPSPNVPGVVGKRRAGWQKDSKGREIFIHPSRLEELLEEEWGEDETWQ